MLVHEANALCSECSEGPRLGNLHSWPQFKLLVRLHPFFQRLRFSLRRDHILFKIAIIVSSIYILFFVCPSTNVSVLASSLASIVSWPVSLALPYMISFSRKPFGSETLGVPLTCPRWLYRQDDAYRLKTEQYGPRPAIQDGIYRQWDQWLPQ